MERIRINEHDPEQRLAAIQSQKQTLAPAMLKQDKAALKRWEELDAEAAQLRRHGELQEMALREQHRLAAEQEAEAAQLERKKREAAATQEASIILDADKHIDELLAKLSDMFQRRRRAATVLQATRVVAPTLIFRLMQRQGATRAAHAAGLRDFIAVEPVMPAHVQKLADVDAWLAKPLTLAADEPMPDETGPKSNGADQ